MIEFADVEKVVAMLGCSKAKAYEVIRALNLELKEKGFLTIQGKINIRYLIKRFGLERD